MKRELIAAAVTAVFFAAPAWAQQMGEGMGGGTMGGGMTGGSMMGPGTAHGYDALNLSEAQRAKIADIEREFAGKQRELAAKMSEARLEETKRIAALLTDEQRAQLRSSSPCHAADKQS